MEIKRTSLPGVLLIALDVFEDERGHFFERYNQARFEKAGLPGTFRQDNHSRSRRGVLRGLHYQLRHPQGKLVSCTRGEIFDVAVDIRQGSPTFGKWVGIPLSEDRAELMWIPPGYAHGFCALSDVAEVQYKCTDLYVPADDRGIIWNDPALAITWPIDRPILSPRDRALPALQAAELPAFSPPFREIAV